MPVTELVPPPKTNPLSAVRVNGLFPAIKLELKVMVGALNVPGSVSMTGLSKVMLLTVVTLPATCTFCASGMFRLLRGTDPPTAPLNCTLPPVPAKSVSGWFPSTVPLKEMLPAPMAGARVEQVREVLRHTELPRLTGPFKVMVLPVVMMLLGGIMLLAALREIAPPLPVLVKDSISPALALMAPPRLIKLILPPPESPVESIKPVVMSLAASREIAPAMPPVTPVAVELSWPAEVLMAPPLLLRLIVPPFKPPEELMSAVVMLPAALRAIA